MPKSNSKQKKPTPPAPKQKPGEKSKNPVTVILYPVITGTAVLLLSVLALSFLLEKSPDPNALLPVAAIICTLLAAAVSGSLSAKLSGKASPTSILSGLIMILVYLIISLFFDAQAFENGMVLKSAIVIILPAMAFVAGTVSAKNKKNQKKR